MTAFVIFDLAPLDPVGMKRYLDGANASVKLFGGKKLEQILPGYFEILNDSCSGGRR